jgi:urea transporter
MGTFFRGGIFILMYSRKNPAVSRVTNSHTAKSVISRNSSKEPVKTSIVSKIKINQKALSGIFLLFIFEKYVGNILFSAELAINLEEAIIFALTALAVEIKIIVAISPGAHSNETFPSAVTATNFDEPTSAGVSTK